LSVAAWINPDGVSVPRPIIEWTNGLHLWESVTYGGAVGPGNLYANLQDTQGNAHIISSAPGIIQPGQWQLVALTYDKTTGIATLYLDGHVVAQQTLGSFTPNTRSDLNLGQRPANSFGGYPTPFAGILDDVGIYDRALSASEIQALFVSPRLDPIQGAVTVNGNGVNTVLNVNDAGTSSAQTYQLFATQLLRYPSPPAGQALGNPTQTINYFYINHVYVHGGTASDTWFVNSTLPGTITDLYSAGGTPSTENAFVVDNSATVLDGIQGPLGLHGGGGGPFYDFLTAHDDLNAVGHTYTLTTGELQRDGMANITYDSLGEFLLYAANNPYVGHTPGNTINVQSIGSISATVAAGTGDAVNVGQTGTMSYISGTLSIGGPGPKQVTLDDSADTQTGRHVTLGSDPASGWGVSGLSAGKIYVSTGSNIKVLGGPVDKVFLIHDFTNAPSINLVAEPATSTRTNQHNKLDYSAYTGTVQVILPLGMATGFAHVSGIQDVTGGQGNSLIVGSGNPGVLVGGTGRNVLIGEAGGGTLDGSRSTGDNILIGGTTIYDTSLAALDAIFAEWTRTDLSPTTSYHIRFSDLSNGLMVNGQLVVLNNTTVHGDNGPDTLIGSIQTDPTTGARVHNWFFDDGGTDDTLINFLRSSDHETRVM
jgi:hypothetical protein